MCVEQNHHHNDSNLFVNPTIYIPLEPQSLHPAPVIHLPSSSTASIDQID